jgi:hypothetical protein
MRQLFLFMIALIFVGVQIPAVLAQQEATPPAAPPDATGFLEQLQSGQVCAWPIELDVNAFNVGFPDVNSSYFLMPYILSPDQSFVVEGAFPFARFSSINTYYRDLGGQGTGLELLGWLPDFAITPEAGSTNPAIDPNASTDPAQRQWTVRVTGTASVGDTTTPATPVDGQNVLPAMPTGMETAIGVMVLRNYVPTDASDHSGGVGLPTISLENVSGESRELTPCTAEDRDTWHQLFMPFAVQIITEAPQLPLPPSADAAPEWVQNRFPGLGTNPDNRYLMAPVAWEPGRIVVIRGQAPTFPDTRAGEPQTTLADLRYWTFCTGSNVVPMPSVDCLPDFEMPIAADGTYTFVVSQPEDQPANATVEEGVGWLRGGKPQDPDLLYLRHLLPSEAFHDQSVWAVPENVVGAAEEIMGPYYPQITYCDTVTFEEGGADACFETGEAATPAN